MHQTSVFFLRGVNRAVGKFGGMVGDDYSASEEDLGRRSFHVSISEP